MDTQTARLHIQDAFYFLVSSAGSCNAIYLSTSMEPHWIVHFNGRLYVETRPDCEEAYHFECKTDYGTVKVSFPRENTVYRGQVRDFHKARKGEV